MPNLSDIVTTTAKSAGTAAGLGAGGGITFAFFDQAHGGELIQRGDAYGLTAFAFIALILLIASYYTLPASVSEDARKLVGRILAVFAVLSIGGFLFQVIVQVEDPPVTIKAAFYQDLDRLNDEFHIPKKIALQATLSDGRGFSQNFVHGKAIVLTVKSGLQLTVDLAELPDALRQTIELKVADSSCRDAACNPHTDGGDDVGHQ
jgi:hypothetical protein